MADTVSSLSAPATRLDDLPFTAIGGQPAFAPGTIEPFVREPRVCLTIQDERPPYRALLADGRVTLEPLPQGDADPTAGMAVRYFGRVAAAEYDRMTAEEYARKGLVLITLRPTELRGFDNSRTLNAAVLAFVRLRDRLPIPRSWL